MANVDPIKSRADIKKVEKILMQGSYRNYMMFKIGINLGLRISDMLKLNIKDVKNKDFINIIEQKTKKKRCIPINQTIKEIIKKYTLDKGENMPLFPGINFTRLSRITAYRIIHDACKKANIKGNFGTHTLRKTFGYHFYKKFKDIAMLQKILNHSHPSTTLRYIGIEQEEIYRHYRLFVL